LTPLKVLVLSRNYPNNVTPLLGLWTEGLIRQVASLCETRVLAPVPYCPPIPGAPEFTKFRSVAYQERINGVDVRHPRFLTGPGFLFHSVESEAYSLAIYRQVAAMRREFPFDLIHAHFVYPDGVVAARLGRRYNVPVIITDQSPWTPWMENYPRVRQQAVWAAQQCAFHTVVSKYLKNTVVRYTGESEKLQVVPNGVDASVFTPLSADRQPKDDQILFVGIMRHVKGVDILLKAMRKLVDRRPGLKLTLVGGGFYRSYSAQEKQLRDMARELGLDRNVEFVGMKPPEEVAAHMRESALLVTPSRSETFGSVLIEALACGIPVVSTRCGGPEDFVTEEVGRLVPKEDEAALAEAIDQTLDQRRRYDPLRLRQYALDNFTWERVAQKTVGLYEKALGRTGSRNGHR
jgi:glycosyltransferase involved in cell wall biosynthesis